jgi:multidrug resistance efflux pump
MSNNNETDTPSDLPESANKDNKVEDSDAKKSPVKKLTFIVLVISFIFFLWYVFSDRQTPYTEQARITELIIPITPRVSGYLSKVNVTLNSTVSAQDVLFQIDTVPFVVAVRKAEAKVDDATQNMGAGSASVKSAASSVGVARAQLDRSQRNYDRTMRIMEKNPGAVSKADIDRVETSLEQSKERLSSSQANYEKAQTDLGVVGPDNPKLRMALSELEKAQLELSFCNIYAPLDGYIESFNIDIGYYCQAGQPLATLVSKQDIWIQADFKENNLSNMKVGNRVKFILDIEPGKVFKGQIRSIGYGVDAGTTVNRGGLPAISSSSSWLRDPQRFPVTIVIEDAEARELCRAGSQADVVVYTGHHVLLNKIASLRVWINSKLSYVR